MKSYAFALQKGGTGKTSISVSVAVEMARRGKKVVYIDCDPQGNSSSWLLNDFEHELADILYDRIPVLECVYQSDLENLFVIPTFGVGGSLKQFAKNEHYPFKFQKQILPELHRLQRGCPGSEAGRIFQGRMGNLHKKPCPGRSTVRSEACLP